MEAAVAGYFPLDYNVASALRSIPRDIVPDMPDRIIAATALHLGLPLDFEGGIVLAELADNPRECIGGDAPAFDQVNNLNERDG